MRVHSVSFQNYKSFRDEVTIPLGKISYFIGPNGAGKSNILSGLETILSVVAGGDYAPKAGDYFDGDAGASLKLGAVLELSDAERSAIAGSIAADPGAAAPHGDPGRWLFTRLKYEASFSGTDAASHEILLTVSDERLHPFVRIGRSGGKYNAEKRNIGLLDAERGSLPAWHSYRVDSLNARLLFEQIDMELFVRARDHFLVVRNAPTRRRIPGDVPVHETHDITSDGSNIANELGHIPRAAQIEFDELLAKITGGAVRSVEPTVRGSRMTLEATERGLSRRTTRTDFSSGIEQIVLLAWQLSNRHDAILLLNEPELHLHARAQKEICDMIRTASTSIQIVVETHSPVFLGAGPDERVVLVTKEAGRSLTTEIGPDNVDLIRRELGITHADALHHTNILFAEGRSDLVAFGPFLKAVSPEHALSTMIYSLDGAHNTKNLGMLIRYLKAEGRRMFAILDDNDEAKRLVEKLESDGLLAGNFHFLVKSLEDEFDDDLVVRAARSVAADAGGSLSLTAAELRASRDGGEAVAAALKKRWNATTCGPLSKVDLARSIVSLAGGRIPPGIEAALLDAVAHFGAPPAGAGDNAG